jgi:hypothetical protein
MTQGAFSLTTTSANDHALLLIPALLDLDLGITSALLGMKLRVALEAHNQLSDYLAAESLGWVNKPPSPTD